MWGVGVAGRDIHVKVRNCLLPNLFTTKYNIAKSVRWKSLIIIYIAYRVASCVRVQNNYLVFIVSAYEKLNGWSNIK